MTTSNPEAVVERDGTLIGPTGAPVNRMRSSGTAGAGGTAPGRGSIHDDATAQRLGFRGGTIAGSVHMDQFPPVLVAAFGSRWFETGSLSLTFRNATISGEEVIAMAEKPDAGSDDVQVAARMERPDGTLVAEGTASIGTPAEPTHLHSLTFPEPLEAARILEGIEPGHKLRGHSYTPDPSGVKARIEAGSMTAPLDWYTGTSPWGGPIANPSSAVQGLRNRGGDFGPNISESVGLFGAIELRFHHGPLMCGTTYRVEGEVVAVGSSPKTEYVWYDSRAFDPDERLTASMRMQLRWMKASSPLYSDESE